MTVETATENSRVTDRFSGKWDHARVDRCCGTNSDGCSEFRAIKPACQQMEQYWPDKSP